MGLRFPNMKALRKAISQDVVIVDDQDFTPLKKELVKLSRKAQRTHLEDKFLENWEHLGGPGLVREHVFHDTRKWRFDFAHVQSKTAVEIMGGLNQAQSGHRSRDGVKRDYEKSNAAQGLGWIVFSLTSDDLQSRAALENIIKTIGERSK